MLVDASSVPATDLHLVNGSAIILGPTSIGTSQISIRYEHARVSSESPGSVLFNISGTGAGFTHVESSAPYTLLGDKNKRAGLKYKAWSPDAGVYKLTVTAFAAAAGSGEVLKIIQTTLTIQDGEDPKASIDGQTPATSSNHDDSDANTGDLHMAVISLVVTLAMVATTIGVVRQRHRQRLSALGLDWDDQGNPDGVDSVNHDFADPASKMDADFVLGGSRLQNASAHII
jgi:hypothetical protein